MSTLCVVPARWASTRLPGKPLADLAGKPLVQWTWERAKGAKSVDRVVIATDHDEVRAAAEAFGAEVVMTPAACPTGTDRAAAVAKAVPDAQVVVNVQGDEPLLDPAVIDAAVRALADAPWASVATAVTPIHNPEVFQDPHTVKAVLGEGGRALYFSRSPIPSRARTPPAEDEPWGMKHLGLYVFRREALISFASRPPARAESVECLEQLRFLAAGEGIVAIETPHDAVGVDTPEDLAVAARLIRDQEGL